MPCDAPCRAAKKSYDAVQDPCGERQVVRGVRGRTAAGGRVGTSPEEGGSHGAPRPARQAAVSGLHRRSRLLPVLGVQGKGEEQVVATPRSSIFLQLLQGLVFSHVLNSSGGADARHLPLLQLLLWVVVLECHTRTTTSASRYGVAFKAWVGRQRKTFSSSSGKGARSGMKQSRNTFSVLHTIVVPVLVAKE